MLTAPVQYTVSTTGNMISLWQNTTGFGTTVSNDSAALLCEWDSESNQPGDAYARKMVEIVLNALADGSRILMLGAGCGVVTAGLLCASVPAGAGSIDIVDSVELSTTVIELADERFLPAITGSGACAGAGGDRLRERRHIVQGDALHLHRSPNYEELRSSMPFSHILVDVPPVYLPNSVEVTSAFWADLGRLSSGDGSQLVVNTFNGISAGGGKLRNDLLFGGWAEVREVKVYDFDEQGNRVFNMIVLARDWWPWLHPSRWTRWIRERFRVRAGPVQLVLVVLYLLGLASLLLCACMSVVACGVSRCLALGPTARSRLGCRSRLSSAERVPTTELELEPLSDSSKVKLKA